MYHNVVAIMEVHLDVLACIYPALVLSVSLLFGVVHRHFAHISLKNTTSLWSENFPTWLNIKIIFACMHLASSLIHLTSNNSKNLVL